MDRTLSTFSCNQKTKGNEWNFEGLGIVNTFNTARDTTTCESTFNLGIKNSKITVMMLIVEGDEVLSLVDGVTDIKRVTRKRHPEHILCLNANRKTDTDTNCEETISANISIFSLRLAPNSARSSIKISLSCIKLILNALPGESAKHGARLAVKPKTSSAEIPRTTSRDAEISKKRSKMLLEAKVLHGKNNDPSTMADIGTARKKRKNLADTVSIIGSNSLLRIIIKRILN